MNDKTIRAQILESFLENLSGIADKEYQKRVWIEERRPECDDIDDSICDFFDEGLIVGKKY